MNALLKKAILDALVNGLRSRHSTIEGAANEIYFAVKDRLAQECQTSELKGETPVELHARMFKPSGDEDTGGLMW